LKVYSDEIIHAFESHGNLHMILGVCSGKVDNDGRDLKDEVVTLIIPNKCAKEFSSNLGCAINQLLDFPSENLQEIDSNPNKTKEFLGLGVSIKI